MPNFLYKNIAEILSTNQPIRGIRFNYSDLNKKIVVPKFSTINNPEDPSSPGTNVELHLFLQNGAYVDTLYSAKYNIFAEVENGVPLKYVDLPIHEHLQTLKPVPGPYRVVYNFFRNLIGANYSESRLFVSDISTDRKEIRLSVTNQNDQTLLDELSNFVLEYMRGSKYTLPIILNFGENNIVDIVNVTSDGNNSYFYAKLLEPLPTDVDLYYQCWVSSQIMKPYIDNVQVEVEYEALTPKFIKGPNFEVDFNRFIAASTEYKSWNELLSTNVQTSQEILNRYINTSGSDVKLNIDFTEFENFVFYSSAEERVENFYYKIRLIENYNSQLSALNSYTGSVETNKTQVKLLRDKVVSGFDNFEKWLYNETTSSLIYTNQISGSIKPYPKYEVTGSDYHLITKEGKFKLYDTTTSVVDDWYTNLVDIATDYDTINDNILNKAIPEHIFEDKDNEQFITFVNMVAQHFDILYFYTDHILKKNLRVENPKDGLSQDLIYEATRNLGWKLSSGTQAKDLWEYALGLSGSGEPLYTGKTTVNKYLSKTEEERTKEVWRRVLNNLPYIYKTKGTSRSIKALLSAYGIPQTLLSIREYGGPDNADLGVIPRAEWEKHTYFLNFPGSKQQPATSSYVRIPWERVNNEKNVWQFPDTLTFRWKMEPSAYYDYRDNKIQTILQKQTTSSRVDWFVTVNRTGSDEKGDLTFYIGDGTNYKSASIKDEYLYDDVPLNIMIRRSLTNDSDNATQRYDFILKTAKYGKIVVDRSASIDITGSVDSNYNRAWSSDGNLFVGSGSNIQTSNSLSGSIFELRYWAKQLLTSSFDNHVLSARAYNGNTPTSSFYDLLGQWKFWQPFDAAVTSSIISMHPDQNKTTFYSSSKYAYFNEITVDSFESIVETYNMEVATVSNNTPFSEKVRIDSASLQGGLSINNSSVVTAFDRYSVDSNKLMVAFSPQHIINEDIYESIGYTIIDDYFGEYANTKRDEYPRLKWFAREYWKKYKNRNDFTAYLRLISIFDFSIFDQIRQTLPLRVNEILGVVIEPNILERSKVKMSKDFTGLPPEKFVKDTTEISASASVKIETNSSKTATVYIGFDDDIPSELINIDGEYDVETTLQSEIDDYEDDINVNTNLYVTPNEQTGSIDAKIKNFSGENVGVDASIKNNKTTISATNHNLNAIINSSANRNLVGINNYLSSSAELNLGFTNTFERQNVVHGKTYGLTQKTWYTVQNTYNKRTAVFENIDKGREDGYYSSYKFYYTSSLNTDGTNYSSYEYVTSSLMNPNNYTKSIRNIRFDGCKLPDSEVTNTISYPMYTPNYTYLDVNSDPSALIVLILPFDVLPEWLQQVRLSRGQR
jgi:hypothetical protein